MTRLPYGARTYAPAAISRDNYAARCCPKCLPGHGTALAGLSPCIAPNTCPCHKAERIARLKQYTREAA